MKVKVYRVSLKEDPNIWYFVDAPSKRIAKWCGANLYNNEYTAFKTAKDIKVERFKYHAVEDAYQEIRSFQDQVKELSKEN